MVGKYASGRWRGKSKSLHGVVANLLFGEYDPKLTVDHIISEEKLNNGEDNLRLASKSLQSLNRVNKKKKYHAGVSKCWNKWVGQIKFHRRTYKKSFEAEEKAKCFVNMMRAAFHGI